MKLMIKNASIDELNTMMRWAAKEGWNPGLEDVRSYYLINPHSFYVAYREGEKEFVACVSRVQYSSTYSFLGFFIVRPDQRFHGKGYELVQYLIEQYKTENNLQHILALDGVVQRISKYEKLGFKLAHSNIRYLLPPHSFSKNNHRAILPISAISLPEIAAYDSHVFPTNRFGFLMAWLTQPQTKALAYYDDGLLGFGAIRPAVTGYRIGPLFAHTPDIAFTLLEHLSASVPAAQPIFIDVPICNKEAVKICTTLNMQPTFETGRMYCGGTPNLTIDQIFGITSLEVG